MIQGSNHARTARSATGQQSRGRSGAVVPLLFPPPGLAAGGWGHRGRRHLGRRTETADRLPRRRSERWALLTQVVPTEREGAADQRPMPADRQIRAHLILVPAQGILRLLIALLHPL